MNGQPVVQLQAEQGQVPTHLQKLAGRGKKGFCFFVNILVNNWFMSASDGIFRFHSNTEVQSKWTRQEIALEPLVLLLKVQTMMLVSYFAPIPCAYFCNCKQTARLGYFFQIFSYHLMPPPGIELVAELHLLEWTFFWMLFRLSYMAAAYTDASQRLVNSESPTGGWGQPLGKLSNFTPGSYSILYQHQKPEIKQSNQSDVDQFHFLI